MAMGALLLIAGLLVYLAIIAGLSVLLGFGRYRMAKHAGIPHAWLGLVPFGNAYITGLLAERAVYTYTGKKRSLAFWYLIAQCVVFVGALAVLGLAIWDIDFGLGVGMAVLGLFLGLIACFALGIYCVYYVFKDYSPDNATIYIVLSILFHIYWIFLLVEMNTVPVSVTGFGTWPYGRPKYNQYHQWQVPQGPVGAQPQQPYEWEPVQPFGNNGGQPGQPPPYQGQGPQFYHGGQPPQGPQTPPPPPGQGYQPPRGYVPGEGWTQQPPEPRFYQGGGYYQPSGGRQREEEGPGGPELK